MKNGLIFLLFMLLVLAVYELYHHDALPWLSRPTAAPSAWKEVYYCPMHPQVKSDKPGECPICHMTLVKRSAVPPVAGTPAQGEPKVLYYRNPMNPEVTSPVPMKDQMGMDYVPVYEEAAPSAQNTFYVSPRKQQMIGVRTAKVEKRYLLGQILTVGRVAYDPTLYVAQEEYLQAVGARGAAGEGDAFAATARRKLLLMGMSEQEIVALRKKGLPEQSLYLPQPDDRKIWVYLTIYEYEASFVKVGQQVEVQALAYPADVFKGKVVSIAPMLDVLTRSLKVRALVDNPGDRLKLEMYVNVRLTYDLGEKLAIPEQAVMNTGVRTYVFRTQDDGYFLPVDVTIGAKAHGYYEVLSGLTEGENIVTSGNFLIDSESKLSTVLSSMAEPNAAPGARKP